MLAALVALPPWRISRNARASPTAREDALILTIVLAALWLLHLAAWLGPDDIAEKEEDLPENQVLSAVCVWRARVHTERKMPWYENENFLAIGITCIISAALSILVVRLMKPKESGSTMTQETKAGVYACGSGGALGRLNIFR